MRMGRGQPTRPLESVPPIRRLAPTSRVPFPSPFSPILVVSTLFDFSNSLPCSLLSHSIKSSAHVALVLPLLVSRSASSPSFSRAPGSYHSFPRGHLNI